MSTSRTSALISLVVVFLSGVLVGGVAYRLYMVNTVLTSTNPANPPGPPSRRPSPEEVRKRLVNETRDRCNLDPQQVQRLEALYDTERQEFDRLRKKWSEEGRTLRIAHSERIKAILRPDQIPLFDKLQAEREERDRRRRQQDQKDHK
jgi:hypothetical protein